MTHSPSIGASAGVGLKPQHYAEALADARDGLWFEVHPENYMVAGGPRLAWLAQIRMDHPLSLHGVGMSLAGAGLPDQGHLAALRRLIDRFAPFVVSEHLAWSRSAGTYAPDLLPFPRSRQALDRIVRNIDHAQSVLGVGLLIENPSLYMPLAGQDYDEVDFLAELVTRTGCGLLVDINNVHVSAHNLGYDAAAYLARIPASAVGEVHLAGHAVDAEADLLIDSHAALVADPVWDLYYTFIERIGPRPTLIERDGDIPGYDALMQERDQAHQALAGAAGGVLAHA